MRIQTTRRASSQLTPEPPVHVGIIPDGTRRWSRANAVALVDGYRIALTKLSAFTDYLFDRGVEAVTLYLLSRDNLKRTEDDLAAVFAAETWLCDQLLPPVVRKHGCRVTIAGDLSELPADFQEPWRRIETTGAIGNKRIYLCVAYDPMAEIQFALQRATCQQELFSNLWVAEPVDLVFRSAGENRLSSFLPLQCSYAELCFVSKLFNDVTVADLDAAIDRCARVTSNHGA